MSQNYNSTETPYNIFKLITHYLLLLAPLVIFGPVLAIYFTGEDFVFIRFVTTNHPFYAASQNQFYRPLPNLLWQLDYSLYGLNAWGYHLTNLLWHAANVVLVMWLVQRLTRDATTARLAAILFAMLPTHVEAVVWIAGRPDLTATFFGLLTLLGGLKFFDRYEAGKSGRLYYALSLLAFGVAVFCKESVVALPLLLVALVWMLKKPIAQSWFSIALIIAPYFLVLGFYLGVRWFALDGWGGYAGDGHSWFNILWNLTLGLWLPLLFPINLASAGGIWGTVLSIALLGFYGWLGWRVWRKQLNLSGWRMALVLMYGSLLPTLNISPVLADLEQSRLLYLPSVGFCLLGAIVIRAACQNLADWRKLILTGGTLVYIAALAIAILPWWQAGNMTKATFDQLNNAHLAIHTGDTLYFENLPDNWHGAYIWRNGIADATALLVKSKVGVQLAPTPTAKPPIQAKNHNLWPLLYRLETTSFWPKLRLNLPVNKAS